MVCYASYQFLHNYIKQAVKARYCPTKGHRWAVASAQFDYFMNLKRMAQKSVKSNDMQTSDDLRKQRDVQLQRADEELIDLGRFVGNMVLNTNSVDDIVTPHRHSAPL